MRTIAAIEQTGINQERLDSPELFLFLSSDPAGLKALLLLHWETVIASTTRIINFSIFY
jgi:hypothetical protein